MRNNTHIRDGLEPQVWLLQQARAFAQVRLHTLAIRDTTNEVAT
jgi:hypothetical protein